MNILFFASNFPDPVNKTWAPWNKKAVESTLNYANPTVIVPRPFAPPFSRFTHIPHQDLSSEYPIYYPRFLYPLPKSLFYCFAGESYRYFIGRFIEKALNNEKLTKPDIIHALHPYLDGYGGVLIAKKLRVPIVVTVHSSNNLQTCPEKVLSTLKAADAVITIAEFLKKELINIGIPEEKVKHVSLGVDPEEFKPLPKNLSKIIAKKYNISSDDKIILYVGRLSKEKNVEAIIKVASSIITNYKFKKLRFVFIGEGPEKKKLQNLSLKLGTDKNVIFTGGLAHNSPELQEWYGIADIFVLPSLSEGKPVAIYEAMSSGCAIVASNINGIPEQVIDGVNGFLIDPYTTTELADKIIYLLENEGELEKMKRNSRRLLFKMRYTWEDYAKNIDKIYSSITR